MWATAHDFNTLPHDGGTMQQPARWMKILQIFETENHRKTTTTDSSFDTALGD